MNVDARKINTFYASRTISVTAGSLSANGSGFLNVKKPVKLLDCSVSIWAYDQVTSAAVNVLGRFTFYKETCPGVIESAYRGHPGDVTMSNFAAVSGIPLNFSVAGGADAAWRIYVYLYAAEANNVTGVAYVGINYILLEDLET